MHKHLLVSSPGRKIINCVASVSRSRHSAPAPDFQKSSFELASSPAPESFKFEREDWTLFRTVEGLQQKASVPATRLRRLVLKEIADNALDTTRIETGQIDGRGFYVADTGSGIDGSPEDIARLFSIARPLVSTTLWRLPTRGALGNGLRVVAGSIAPLVAEVPFVVEMWAAKTEGREQPNADTLAEGVEKLFNEKPDAEWRDYIETLAIKLTDQEPNK